MMIKLVLWFPKHPEITTAEMYDGNHRVHSELVHAAPTEFKADVLRYTQSYPFDGMFGRTDTLRFDGVSELWFESPERLQAHLAHPYFQDVIFPDGAQFSDQDASAIHLAVEEVVQQPLRGQGVKVLRWLQALDGVDTEAFESFWLSAQERAAGKLTGLLGYARNRIPAGAPVMAGTPPTAYDAIWIDDREDIPALLRSTREFLDAGEAAGVLDRQRCFTLLCSERRVLDTFA
jgi:EthD domain